MARRGLLALTDDLLDLAADRFERDAQRFQSLGGDAFALVDEAEQDVLGADVVVFEKFRFFLREHHNASCSVGEPFEHLDVSRGPRIVPRAYRPPGRTWSS